jgi:hypothetical protein
MDAARFLPFTLLSRTIDRAHVGSGKAAGNIEVVSARLAGAEPGCLAL